jgi:hypothetical protein
VWYNETVNPQKISRRTLLTGALSTVALAALEACQPPIATSVPATGETPASPTQTPTAINTPSATKTPWPTATVASYTRPSKLGLVVPRFSSPQIMEVIQVGRPKVIKVIDDLGATSAVKEHSPNTLIIGRVSVDYDFSSIRAKGNRDADRHAASFIAKNLDKYQAHANVDYWEGYNEPAIGSAELMAEYAAFEVERVKQMAALGYKCCIGNFATGTPSLELWDSFLPALKAAQEQSGCLGLHEYSAPTMQFGFGRYQLDPAGDSGDEGWYTLRYRKAYRHHIPAELRIPLIITECGIDGLIEPRPGPAGAGWRDFNKYWKQNNLAPDGVTGYLDQLTWYDQELQEDAYVIGATIYAAGADSYDVLGDMADKLAWYWSAHPHS